MGAIISRFRGKKSTKEQLEEIEKEINDIEDLGFYTQQRRKRFIGSFIFYSIVLYIIAIIIFYFFYFPLGWKKQIYYSSPFFAFPLLLWVIKKLLNLYFTSKLEHSADKLAELRRRKKRLLEEVMDKETYKVAKEILERYDPERAKKEIIPLKVPLSSTSDLLMKSAEIAQMTADLRKRVAGRNVAASRVSTPQLQIQPAPVGQIMSGRILQKGSASALFSPPALVVGRARPMRAVPPFPQPPYSLMAPGRVHMSQQMSQIFRPLRPKLPSEKGYIDKIIEFVVGDGPTNRYALICQHCHNHNGMALKEEFEFVAFRCCYCSYYNPPRKQRLNAPKLPSLLPSTSKSVSSSESGESCEEGEKDEEPAQLDENKTPNVIFSEDSLEEQESLGSGVRIEEIIDESKEADSIDVTEIAQVEEEQIVESPAKVENEISDLNVEEKVIETPPKEESFA